MSLSVLLVDGDAQSLGLAARNLEDEGLDVYRAGGCSGAEEILDSKKVDCIVTEYSLPGSEGVEVCRFFDSQYSDVPLILFSAYRDPGLLQEVFENGVDDYVSKDIGKHKFSVLVDRIRHVAGNVEDKGFSSRITSDLRVDEYDFLRQLIDVLPLGVAVRDANDRVVMANEYIARGDTGLDEIIGANLEDSKLTEDQIDTIRKSDEEAIRKGRPIKTEEEVIDLEGNEKFIETTKIPFELDKGENPHLASVFQDISFRKKKERVLEKVIETNREMAKADSEGEIWCIASETMKEIFEMPSAAGFEPERSRSVLRPVESTRDSEEIFDEIPNLAINGSLAGDVFRTGSPRFVDQMSDADPANPDTPVHSEAIVSVGDHGVLIAGTTEEKRFDQADLYIAEWFGSSVEASLSRVEREKKIRRRDEKLERQTQQIDQFVKMLSHDLRNPLNVAQGYLDMVAEAKEVEQVEEALDRMEEIIQTMLEMAKHTGEIEKQRLKLGEIARESWKYDYVGRASLELGETGVIEANRKQFKHLLENLFSNAIEHSEGEISVEVGMTENGFYVKDDGCGISDDLKKKVFDFGYSTADSTGLGLAIVERIAKFQGWEVGLEDSEEGGVLFRFRTD